VAFRPNVERMFEDRHTSGFITVSKVTLILAPIGQISTIPRIYLYNSLSPLIGCNLLKCTFLSTASTII